MTHPRRTDRRERFRDALQLGTVGRDLSQSGSARDVSSLIWLARTTARPRRVRGIADDAMREDPEVVIPRLRSLRYPYDHPQEPAVEKGVDVNLALGAIEMVLADACDVAIVFSHDTDLAPLPEAIARLKSPAAVETVSWESPSFQRRLRPKASVYHHYVSEAVFSRVETRVNYAHAK